MTPTPAAPPGCPPAATLQAFHRGDASPAEADAVAAHLEGCPACEAALQALDAAEGTVVADLRRPPAAGPAADCPGTVVGGRYTLAEPLGEGGMGQVWKARQTAPVRRDVAVKLVKPGMDTAAVLRRFEAERQALALMDHPHIATVLDAGTTDRGRPFFVMELVAGVPLTDYCDARRLGLRERLGLFVPVCRAVQHAHQKGVIHRDLKPSNILVAEVDGKPVPKVIDFGIAKAAGATPADQTAHTGLGAVVGTPEYMAPEQADPSRHDVDTRADVYALGVVLYELLTGTTPLTRARAKRAALLEVLRLVREEEPPPPSSRLSTADAMPGVAARRGTEPARLSRLVRGELDWVVMKALEKDRGRRYESAGGFARDVERFLADEPVEAGRPTRAYRLRRLARRHRRALLAATALGLLLAAAAGVSTWQAWRAVRAEGRTASALDEAVQERNQKQAALDRLADEQARTRAALARARDELASREAVQGFFQKMVFAAARPKGQQGGLGKDVSLRQAVDAAAPDIGETFRGRPPVEAAVRAALGETYFYLGEPALSAAEYERAARLREDHLGADHPDTIDALGNLAAAYDALGRGPEALRLGERVLAHRRATLGPDDPATLAGTGNLAVAYLRAGRPDDAVRLAEVAAARTRATLGPADHKTLVSEGVLATAYARAGRWPEAIALHEGNVARLSAELGPDDPNTLTTRAGLAQVYLDAGRAADAVRLAEGTAARMAAVLGADHPNTLINQGTLAQGYARSGRAADAARLATDALARARATSPADHPVVLAGVMTLATARLAGDRPADALPLVAEFAGRRRAAGAGTAALGTDLVKAGELLVRHDQFAAAELYLREGLAVREAAAAAPWQVAQAKSLLGAALAGRRQFAAAEPLLLGGYDGLRGPAADLPAHLAALPSEAADRVVRLYAAWGKPAEAGRWRAERAKHLPEQAPRPRPAG